MIQIPLSKLKLSRLSICFLTAVVVLSLTGISHAATSSGRYGTFTLDAGTGYIIRSGKKVPLSSLRSVEVFTNDLIRLGSSASGVLVSSEKATINVGSNAVLKVKSWSNDSSRGFLNLLYGKIKATIAGLRKNESFNIKTANSVIGVKGTEYSAGASDKGDSYVWTIADYTYLTDTLRKKQMIVPNGYYATNFREGGLQKMIAVEKKDVDIAQLSSAKFGNAKKASFADEFFVKREDVGRVPFVNRESLGKTLERAGQYLEEVKPKPLLQINIQGSFN